MLSGREAVTDCPRPSQSPVSRGRAPARGGAHAAFNLACHPRTFLARCTTRPFLTSGHALVADLKRFATALDPRRLVPIHSFETGRVAELFDNVDQRDDGVWWEV